MSGSDPPPGACAAVPWQEIPAEALPLVLLRCVSQRRGARLGQPPCVATLCAAACVSRAWRAAATDPLLWRSLRLAGWRALTDAALALLVARAGGTLSSVDVSSCPGLTAGGVLRALDRHGIAARPWRGEPVALRPCRLRRSRRHCRC